MLSVGSDAEVCLVDLNGNPFSSEGLLGGSKKIPRQTTNGAVQEDNVLAEFNVNPAVSEIEFITNTKLILQDLREIITPLDLSIEIVASANYNPKQLRSRQARRAGCDPDYNAWTGTRNPAPNFIGSTMRTCGGHLHAAFPEAEEDIEVSWDFAKVMDLIAGVPSILMDRDSRRRQFYGAAGAFRPKHYTYGDPYCGVEYRTLSSFWLKSEKTIGWAFRSVRTAYDNWTELLAIANAEKDRILKAINEDSVETAESLVNTYGLEVVDV